MGKEFVDLENFYFFLKEYPYVYSQFRSLKSGDKNRTEDEKDRLYINNLRWAEDLVPRMIRQAVIVAKIIKQQLKEKMGLDA